MRTMSDVSMSEMFSDGTKDTWMTAGKLHRTDGPAYVRKDGTETLWALHGHVYRGEFRAEQLNLPRNLKRLVIEMQDSWKPKAGPQDFDDIPAPKTGVEAFGTVEMFALRLAEVKMTKGRYLLHNVSSKMRAVAMYHMPLTTEDMIDVAVNEPNGAVLAIMLRRDDTPDEVKDFVRLLR